MTIINNILINIPNNWFTEQNSETISIFDPNGKGAVTLSFTTANNDFEFSAEYMRKNFDENIARGKIKLEKSVEVDMKNPQRVILTGMGKNEDNWLIKFYLLSNSKTMVLVTYYTLEKTKEIKIVDKMIDTINFI